MTNPTAPSRHYPARAHLFIGCAATVGLVFSCFASAQTPKASTYGPKDRLGAANNLSPEIVKRAASLIKTGKVYSLAVETKPPAQAGMRHYRAIIQPLISAGSNKTTGYEDTVMTSPSLGTSLDGLGHIGRDGVHYNGVRAEDVYGMSGAQIFSIDMLPPIVTRGILLDVARHRKESVIPGGTAINQADIEAVAKAQGLTIQRGDVVLFHTGWLESAQDISQDVRLPGLGKDGARYLAKLGVVALGADTPALEVFPAETKGESVVVHQILLADNGVYILESVKTSELARDRAYEFLFTVAAPRLVGTVQSTIHPIAIR